jgi:basic membrane lipoprotein Med (substrate-binding protein (PBP1-ABC) superfamily)
VIKMKKFSLLVAAATLACATSVSAGGFENAANDETDLAPVLVTQSGGLGGKGLWAAGGIILICALVCGGDSSDGF